MALSNEKLDIRPKTGSTDDNPQHVTVHDPERGGWYPVSEKEPGK
jgi:hypothetical protein